MNPMMRKLSKAKLIIQPFFRAVGQTCRMADISKIMCVWPTVLKLGCNY